MSAKHVNNREHWRERAVQMRTMSDWIEDAATKATMLDLADQYDRLAKRVPMPTLLLTSGEVPGFGP
jgi:hypothetical protein